MRDAGCHARYDLFANTPKQVPPSSVCKPMPVCPLMATSMTYGLYSGGATLETKREALARLSYPVVA